MAHYPQTIYKHVTVSTEGSLIGRRRQTAQKRTLQYQLKVLKQTGRYDAFDLQWHSPYDDKPMVEPIPNHLFWDSDIAKWIEAASYLDIETAEVVTAVDELIRKIEAAQREDGYLNIHYTVVEPGKRFTNLKDMHELYNLGHLIEAALAHQQCYGNNALLEPILRYVDLVDQTFGPPPKIPGYPGHPEIELALLRLYEITKEPRHLSLARFFLTERGQHRNGSHFFDDESRRRGDDPTKSQPAYYPFPRSYWYHQAHDSIVNQQTIEGHSVRAVYLLTAVADMLRIDSPSGDPTLHVALQRLWQNMVGRKMTITGGIGSEKQWEGFGPEYALPQGTEDAGGSYYETCASIGLMMLAERLLKLDLDSQYTDIMELALYNTVLTSMSHNGIEFTYENQLASSDSHLSKREPFFICACCPPNVCRCLGMVGGYAWDWTSDINIGVTTVIAHLFIQSTLSFDVDGQPVQVTQSGDWPWASDIHFQVDCPQASLLELKVRIPQYVGSNFDILPACSNSSVHKGYLHLPTDWLAQNRKFTVRLPLRPRFVTQHPYVQPRTIAVARGPIVYCAEDVDNVWVQDHFRSIMIDLGRALIEENTVQDEATRDSYVGLSVTGGVFSIDTALLDRKGSPLLDVATGDFILSSSQAIPRLNLVPYYFRANRGGKGHMRVGFQRMQAPIVANGYH